MDLMTEIINALRVLIPVAGGLRIVICLLRIVKGDESSIPENKQRLWHTIYFIVISECVWGIRDVIFDYYIGGRSY